MKMKQKKGISPVVSTVLLITMTIILAAIILLWARGFIKESLTKEIGGDIKRVESRCSEISADSILNDDVGKTFGFTNTGNVPIYAVDLKLAEKDSGSSKVEREGGVNPGFSIVFDYNYDEYEEVKVIPILLGKTKSGSVQEFTCPERNGFVI